jgi:hypothetical protein
MAYGSKVQDKKIPSVGVQENCSIVGDTLFVLADDMKSASITFAQADGATVITRVWDSEEEKAQADANAWVHHVCTKIVDTETYEAAVAGATSFQDFINRANAVTAGQFAQSSFRMLFHYNKKGFITTPRYAPFIEPMDSEKSAINTLMSGTTKAATYIKSLLVRPEQPKADPELTSAESDSLPF